MNQPGDTMCASPQLTIVEYPPWMVADLAKSGITPEMAIRLEKAGWSTADHWLRMQLSYDLWNARQRASKIKVKRFEAPAAA